MDVNWQWCLLTLAGNNTIVQRRKKDFIHYLKMNIASLIGSDDKNIAVNDVTYIPDLLVNVTLDWNLWERIVRVLSRVADDKDVLLYLSGQHFNLTGFTPSSVLLESKPVAHLDIGGKSQLTAKQIESLVFTMVGIAIAFLLTASLLFSYCKCALGARKHVSIQTGRTKNDEKVCLATAKSKLPNQFSDSHQESHSIFTFGFGPNLNESPSKIHCYSDSNLMDDFLVLYEEEPFITRLTMNPAGSTNQKGPINANMVPSCCQLALESRKFHSISNWNLEHNTKKSKRKLEKLISGIKPRPKSDFFTETFPNRRTLNHGFKDVKDLPYPVLLNVESFKNVPAVEKTRPTDEEINRDVSMILKNLGIESSF